LRTEQGVKENIWTYQETIGKKLEKGETWLVRQGYRAKTDFVPREGNIHESNKECMQHFGMKVW